MGSLFHCNPAAQFTLFSKPVFSYSSCSFPSNCPLRGSINRTHIPIYSPSPPPLSSSLSSSFRVNCKKNDQEDDRLSITSAYDVLGVNRDCSFNELKAAFRARVKQFHPDVRKDAGDSDVMIRRVIRAYEMVSKNHQFEGSDRECLDPFDDPECEAMDIFVNETLCAGKGCSYSCVKRAPHAFTFTRNGTATAFSQGHGDDYEVKLAVGQCPRNCIHYVTPSQRDILDELLHSIMSSPHDSFDEADYLYSLITKAKFENNRYQKPRSRREPMVTIYNVDMF